MWIASEGQASTQVWQSTHMSLSTFAFSFSMEIADARAFTHAGFTTSTFCCINNCYQTSSLHRYYAAKDKK